MSNLEAFAAKGDIQSQFNKIKNNFRQVFVMNVHQKLLKKILRILYEAQDNLFPFIKYSYLNRSLRFLKTRLGSIKSYLVPSFLILGINAY